MRSFSTFLILALLGFVVYSQVVTLTDKNFTQTISSAKYVMVKFYAPWCGHCKTMAPEYVKLAELVKDNGVVIGQVDATVEKQTGQRFNIQGYPTMKFFIDGVDIDYRGQRTADKMFEWIKGVSESVLQEITQEKVDELKQKQNLAVYFGSNAEKRKIIELLNIVDSSLDYFVTQSDTEKLVIYPLNKEPIQFSSEANFTVEQIKQWAMLETLPIVVPLSSKEYLDWVFYDEATMKDVVMMLRQSDVSDEGFEKYENFCEKNKETLKCCVVDKNMDVYQGVKNYLKSNGKSVLALTRDGLKQAYVYPNPINELSGNFIDKLEQSWAQFATEVSEDKHKNIAGNDADKIEYEHVKVLTDSNFTSFIEENEVVFAEFYTTTCAHCVQFAKEYDLIAKNVYANRSLGYEIVALDLKKNKKVATELKIVSFPTFKVYVSGQSVTYEGPRTEQAITNFIQTAKDSKPILAGSIAEVPSPSVVIYDPAEVSSLKLLPALFARYPIYQLREGSQLKVVLRLETESTYSGQYTLEKVSEWLYKKTDPILVNLLNPNIDNKLRNALESKTPLLGLIDVDSSLSVSLQATLEEYCKESSLVCGYAKKEEPNFKEFTEWLNIEADTTSSFLYINTESYDKYVFPKKIEQLSVENIAQFITDVKQGRIEKLADRQPIEQEEQIQAHTVTPPETQEESKESEQTESEGKPTDQEL